jgi:hypothetical protein
LSARNDRVGRRWRNTINAAPLPRFYCCSIDGLSTNKSSTTLSHGIQADSDSAAHTNAAKSK